MACFATRPTESSIPASSVFWGVAVDQAASRGSKGVVLFNIQTTFGWELGELVAAAMGFGCLWCCDCCYTGSY